jgi:hypothetical protein
MENAPSASIRADILTDFHVFLLGKIAPQSSRRKLGWIFEAELEKSFFAGRGIGLECWRLQRDWGPSRSNAAAVGAMAQEETRD